MGCCKGIIILFGNVLVGIVSQNAVPGGSARSAQTPPTSGSRRGRSRRGQKASATASTASGSVDGRVCSTRQRQAVLDCLSLVCAYNVLILTFLFVGE
jgi:hypothetical protein